MVCKYSSHSIVCLFSLLVVSLAVQRLLVSWSPTFLFAFVSFASGIKQKKLSLRLMSRSCFLLAVIYLLFKCPIHFELIFVYGVRSEYSFVFIFIFACGYLVFPRLERYWKYYSFPIVYFCASVQNYWFTSVFMPALCCFNCYVFFIIWNKKAQCLKLWFSLPRLCWLFEVQQNMFSSCS